MNHGTFSPRFGASKFLNIEIATGSKLIAAQLLTGAHFPDQVTWVITFEGRCRGDGTLTPP